MAERGSHGRGMPRVATTVWTISPELIVALDEQLGPPVDSYLNGSQTWLVGDESAGDVVLEFRLHPVAGYKAPKGASHYDILESVVAQLSLGGDPHALRLGEEVRPLAGLWDGLECFAAYGDDIEPARLAALVTAALGRAPDRSGLVDHNAIGDQWNGGRQGVDRRVAPRRARELTPSAAYSPRQVGSRGASYHVSTRSPSIAPKRDVEPAVRTRERLRQIVTTEETDRAGFERVALELPAEHPAVEHERVHGDVCEAEAQPVEHRDQRHRLALDAGLLEHFLHRDLGCRVPDVGPADRVQPPTGIGALGEQDLAVLRWRPRPRPRTLGVT